MSQDIKSILTFKEYRVDSVEFVLNPNWSKGNTKIDLNIRKKVTYDKDKNCGVVKLMTKVFENPIENDYPFSIKLQVSGFFNIECEDDEECEKLLNINAVAILFPYVRALISTYTANANVSPLILPAINVNKLASSEE